MKALIPSYHRSGAVRAIKYAEKIADSIVIATQTKDDYEKYTQEYASVARILYRPCKTAGGNRNTLMSALEDGEFGIMLDDDVRDIQVCMGERWRDTREATRRDIETCFERMVAARASVGGFYPVDTPYYAYKSKEVQKNGMCIGAAMLIVGGKRQHFDETIEACDDYEFVLRTIANGGTTIRFNHFIIRTKADSMKKALENKTRGGMADAYASDAHRRSINLLLRKYGPMAKSSKGGLSITIDRRYA